MLERDFNNDAYQRHLSEQKLMGSRCGGCGNLYLPPRALCPNCYEENMAWESLSGMGRLKAFTTVHIAPSAMIAAGYGRDNPYCVGIVHLDEGPSISAQIMGFDPSEPRSIEIGTPLKAGFINRAQDDTERTFLVFEKQG